MHSPRILREVLRPYIDRFLRNSSLLDQLPRDQIPLRFQMHYTPRKENEETSEQE